MEIVTHVLASRVKHISKSAAKLIISAFESEYEDHKMIFSSILNYGKEITKFSPLGAIYDNLIQMPIEYATFFWEPLQRFLLNSAESNTLCTGWDIIPTVVESLSSVPNEKEFFDELVITIINCSRECFTVRLRNS
jgi:hypothetical protein